MNVPSVRVIRGVRCECNCGVQVLVRGWVVRCEGESYGVLVSCAVSGSRLRVTCEVEACGVWRADGICSAA